MKKNLIWAIRAYQALEHFKAMLLWSAFGIRPVCKHRPTCSQYTIQQIAERGTIIGLVAGFRRILTCW